MTGLITFDLNNFKEHDKKFKFIELENGNVKGSLGIDANGKVYISENLKKAITEDVEKVLLNHYEAIKTIAEKLELLDKN